MAFRGLRDFIRILETRDELIRITHRINPELEITEIVDRVIKGREDSKALLFENTGTKFPLLINAFGSEKRIGLALGHPDLNEISSEIEMLFKSISRPKTGYWEKIKVLPLISRISAWMPEVVRGKGQCQEVIMSVPDLSKIPILKCWPADGGPFITLPCVVTRDPESGSRNVGMYRMQVFGPDLTGMHWHKHKTGAHHYSFYKERRMKMPVSVFLGGDPAYIYSATAPLPENFDEYLLAGFLRREKVRLVKCLTNDLEVPYDADFIIEGYIDPEEELIWEGPFGDHTGFYSLADWYPKFHVTCITHRRDAVYPATIVGIPPQEDYYLGKATERIFLSPMKLSLIPELLDMELPSAGVAHNLAIAKINKTYAGQAPKVMNALWGAGQMMFNKILIVTDKGTDIHDYGNLACYLAKKVNPLQDIIFSKGPLDVLDHSSSKFAWGSKMGIDATGKFEEEIVGERINHLGFTGISEIAMEQVVKIPGIMWINRDLIDKDIPLLILGIRKTSQNTIFSIKDNLLKYPGLSRIKFFVLVDAELDIKDYQSVVWYVTANIDPSRDCRIIEPRYEDEQPHLIVDGTRKSFALDGFTRDWPNPVLSSPETIRIIDNLWTELELGEFVPSPSLKYMDLQKGEGAISID